MSPDRRPRRLTTIRCLWFLGLLTALTASLTNGWLAVQSAPGHEVQSTPYGRVAADGSAHYLHLPLSLAGRLPTRLVLNEIMPLPATMLAFTVDPTADHPWIELHNRGNGSAPLAGYQLCDSANACFVLPEDVPPLPPGGYAVVHLDGAGPSSNSADPGALPYELHAPPDAVLDWGEEGGQCSLFAPGARITDTLVDYVAWGNPPGTGDDLAVAAWIWVRDAYVGPVPEAPGQRALQAGGSIGLVADDDCDAPGCWMLYGQEETTPGLANRGIAPRALNPPDGSMTPDRSVALSWYGIPDVEEYQVQVDDDPAFVSVDFHATTTEPFTDTHALADGTYSWRVRARSGTWYSDWSPVVTFTVLTPEPARALLQAGDLGIAAIRQRKDTPMLCLDGCPEHGATAWDARHTGWNPHDNMYCTRAAIAMIASLYGGRLSQDYISYYAYGQGEPENDQGHGRGLWPNDPPGAAQAHGQVLDWACTGVAAAKVAVNTLTITQVQTYIDNNQPILCVERNAAGLHCCVIDGYDYVMVGGVRRGVVHWIDPANASERRYFWPFAIEYAYVPDRGCVGRSDPDVDGDGVLDTVDDSDGDGMVDLDERERFKTGVDNTDTDGDCVEDKNEVRDYTFDLRGRYSKRPGDLRGGDLNRKELDYDNDGPCRDCCCDGDEDADRDGHSCDKHGNCDGRDTSNFTIADDWRAPSYCRTPTPSPTPTNTPPPTATTRPSATERPTATEEATPTTTGSPTATGSPTPTGTRTVTGTPTVTRTNTPKPGFEWGCCQLEVGGCISGLLLPHECIENWGMWYPGFVCNVDTGLCEPPNVDK